jgi:hypothetical protein
LLDKLNQREYEEKIKTKEATTGSIPTTSNYEDIDIYISKLYQKYTGEKAEETNRKLLTAIDQQKKDEKTGSILRNKDELGKPSNLLNLITGENIERKPSFVNHKDSLIIIKSNRSARQNSETSDATEELSQINKNTQNLHDKIAYHEDDRSQSEDTKMKSPSSNKVDKTNNKSQSIERLLSFKESRKEPQNSKKVNRK